MVIRTLILAVICGTIQFAHAGSWTHVAKFQREAVYDSYESDNSSSTEKQILDEREKIYERTAIAFSELKAPDFSDFSEDAIYDAFWAVFDGPSADKVWLKELKNRIAELSRGEVQLKRSSSISFNARVRGPAEYLVLKKGKSKTKLILGPYALPVMFLD